MNQRPYSSYHGRKSLGRRVLTAIVILLVIALALALVALFVLPNYMTYTADGLQFNLPLPGRGQGGQTAQPQSSEVPGVIVDVPSASPSPSAPAQDVDLSGFARRTPPRGLVALEWGTEPGQGQGAIYDMTEPGAEETVTAEANRKLAYSAAWLAPDWSAASTDREFGQELARRCVALAGLGFDEIIFSEADLSKVEDTTLTEVYTQVRQALDDAGFQGRLSVVVGRTLFTNAQLSELLLPCVAARFDRVYASRTSSWSGVDIMGKLKPDGFMGAASDIVTAVGGPVNTTEWSWAVLPQ